LDLTAILFVNAILSVLGVAIFVAVYLLDRKIKRKFKEKNSSPSTWRGELWFESNFILVIMHILLFTRSLTSLGGSWV